MKNILFLSGFISIALLTGCGGGGSSDTPKDSTDNDPQTTTFKFDGEYSVTVTPHASAGVECGSATGTYTLANDKDIQGTVTDTNGTVYTVTGERDNDGDVTGGFAFSDGRKSADFDGTITDSGSQGTWSDIYGCTGIWTATEN